MSDELDDELRAAAWRTRCPDITEAEIDALDPIERAYQVARDYTGPAIMLAAWRAGRDAALIDEGYVLPGADPLCLDCRHPAAGHGPAGCDATAICSCLQRHLTIRR